MTSKEKRSERTKIPAEHKLTDAVLAGNELSSADVEKLEQTLESDPADAISRSTLLGYYFTRREFSEPNRLRWREHVLWFVANFAESGFLGTPFTIIIKAADPDGYSLYRELWLRHLKQQPDSARVAANAAAAFLLSEPGIATDLANKAQALDSKPRSVKRIVSVIQELEKRRSAGSEGDA